MEEIQLIPTLIASGGIYLGYKIIQKIKRVAIKIGAIALGITHIGTNSDLLSNSPTKIIKEIPTVVTENPIVTNISDGIMAAYDVLIQE
jgi:hypothetical protein